MKYIITLVALLTIISCEKKQNTYNCECSSNRGQIVYKYEKKYDNADQGILPCEAVQDSIALSYPNSGIECFFYNIE